MDNLFKELGLNSNLIEGLKLKEIEIPTEIQAKVIPIALSNKDIIGQSETGSGKTLAYLLPIFQKIDTSKREMQVIILTPTHELSMQIFREVETLSKNSSTGVTSTSVIGDVNINRQIEKLKEKPHVIVGSPVRILELIKMKKISAHTIKTIVVDEADRLLDRKNIESIKAVIKTTLRERQLMFFSATFSPEIIATSKDMMKDPEIIQVEEKDTVNQDISHFFVQCDLRDKILMVRKLVSALEPERAIIFINKSVEIEVVTSKLKFHNLKVGGLHGANYKEDRQRVMEDFRTSKIQLLVASDIAARGLDIKGVTHIINYDIPDKPRDYLHRVGRTGRAGDKGTSISLVTVREKEMIKEYKKTFGIEITEKQLSNGNLEDVIKTRNPRKNKE